MRYPGQTVAKFDSRTETEERTADTLYTPSASVSALWILCENCLDVFRYEMFRIVVVGFLFQDVNTLLASPKRRGTRRCTNRSVARATNVSRNQILGAPPPPLCAGVGDGLGIGAAFTVKVAALLMALPSAFAATHRN